MNEHMNNFLRTASLIELQMLKQMHEGKLHSAIDSAIASRKTGERNEWFKPVRNPGFHQTVSQVARESWHLRMRATKRKTHEQIRVEKCERMKRLADSRAASSQSHKRAVKAA